MFLRDQLQDAYLDWVNNFLTIPAFAEHYGLDYYEAVQIIKAGEAIHERLVAFYKELAA